MIPDPYKRTVRLPVIAVKDELKFFYGGDLPSMKDGTIGELIIPEFSINKDYRLGLIHSETKKGFLPKGTVLMARLSPKSIDPTKQFLKRMGVFPPIDGLFTEIRLESELVINFRGTKNPELLDCTCKTLALPDAAPKSVNHAFTLLSEKFETHRRSHTANVFEQVYYENKPNHWVQLAERRNELYRNFEYELICLCKPWWYMNDKRNSILWACCETKSSNNITVYGITQDSRVVSENYFQIKADTTNWLEKRGYRRFTNNAAEQGLMPPFPPYKKPDGILKLKSIQGKSQLDLFQMT
jgi:hypothetical protein